MPSLPDETPHGSDRRKRTLRIGASLLGAVIMVGLLLTPVELWIRAGAVFVIALGILVLVSGI